MGRLQPFHNMTGVDPNGTLTLGAAKVRDEEVKQPFGRPGNHGQN